MDSTNYLIYQAWMHQIMISQQKMEALKDSLLYPGLDLSNFTSSVISNPINSDVQRVSQTHSAQNKSWKKTENSQNKVTSDIRQENEVICISSQQFSLQNSYSKKQVENQNQKGQEKSLNQSLQKEKSNLKKVKTEKQKSKSQYESKNIAKNYGKAIISFIERRKHFMRKVLAQYSIDEEDFLREIKRCKLLVLTISGLQSIWIDQKCKYAKQIRILSQFFLRKFWLQHVFDSRIVNYQVNLKYRQRMIEILKKPHQFTFLKEY